MVFHIDDTEVEFVGIRDTTEQEAQSYIDYVRERVSDPVTSIFVIACDDGMVDINYTFQGEKFERIRRITGYCATRLYMKSMHAA